MSEIDGAAALDEHAQRYPVIDEMTGEIVSDPDGDPIVELEGHDYLGLAQSMTIEERAAGERAWRYGHVIVDEAQDLTPMQWRMVARRARGHSMTIVGDLAQRTAGRAPSWDELLPPEIGRPVRFDLGTNYRATEELAAVARPVLAALAPDLLSPSAIRNGPEPVLIRSPDPDAELDALVERARADVDDGTVAVIDAHVHDRTGHVAHRDDTGVWWLTPIEAKGMEFDAVIVVEPANIDALDNGLARLYVALTRATERLYVLHKRELPGALVPARWNQGTA
ncbi:MAG: ATP-binding domain-containing protein [Acidimicrobiales bacterium]